MSDHPSTLRAETSSGLAVEWNDRAAVHRVGAANGILSDAVALNRGSFAEMIALVMAFPESERADYFIEKAGDPEYHFAEIAELAARPDFPGA